MTILFYKPYGVVTQFSDRKETGRPTLSDYIPIPGVYAAGRLDQDSEGLLLLTDDGELQHRLTDPRFDHPKTYLAQVEGVPDARALEALQAGVEIQGYRTKPAKARLLEIEPDLPPRVPPIRYRAAIPTSWVEVVLTEGRNRQVRRMTAAVGYPTLRLVRTAIGTLTLGTLLPGQYRTVGETELSPFALGKRDPSRSSSCSPRVRRNLRS